LSTAERVERRLAAVLAADVAGYSADEEGTLAQLKGHRRALVDPKIAKHRGRIVKTTGDGMLVEFTSVVEALKCAVEVQRGMIERNAEVPPEKRIEFRVGIHQGDIIIDGDDIFGDGVNVAARLEGLAETGGICVSGRVQEDARGKLDVAFEDTGEQQLKNIEHSVRVYRIRLAGAAASSRAALPLPDKPSIAVLPFQNMSGDPEQEYFADGVVEEIITAVSRFKNLFVIARNSTFTYKGRVMDVKQVGRELGVRYVLEGSVRQSGNRVRITGQLIDAATGTHLWADHFDGALQDVFELQDQVTANVVRQLVPKVEQIEIERAKRKPTESLDAYDYYLRGMANIYRATKTTNDEALAFFYKAIDLDPDFASAHGWAAVCYTQRKQSGWMNDPNQETIEAVRLARRAIELGRDDPVALAAGGFALAYVGGDFDAGATFIDRATALNPNFSGAWHASGWVRHYLGDDELAIEHLAHATRLSPLDPLMYQIATVTGLAHFSAGRHDDASSWAAKALQEQPDFIVALRLFVASSALAGRLGEAQAATAKLLKLNPELRISNSMVHIGRRVSAFLSRYEEGLRKAGLPE
jgi:TolB-like protein